MGATGNVPTEAGGIERWNSDEEDHRSLARWAADCAEHVLPTFEETRPKDDRPREAVEAVRAWVRGEFGVSDARTAAFTAHAADRTAAREAARAAGHAAATANVPGHARHAAAYAVKAAAATSADAVAATDREREWQFGRLPKPLRPVVFPDGAGD